MMNEKIKKIMFIVIGAFIILFLVLFGISSFSKNITPEKLESQIIENAKEYYLSHESELPKKNSALTLALSNLVSKGIIKDLDSLLEDDTTCSGNLTIENNNNYYLYSPNISCTTNGKTYKTKYLKDLLLEDVVTSGNGLYYMYNSYYFRGDNVNNFIMFNGKLWRITKINSDNSIRLIEHNRKETTIWDNRHNTEVGYSYGINNIRHNDVNSRILDNLINMYNDYNIFSDKGRSYIKQTNLCIGKRNDTDSINDGSIECSITLDNQYVGLLQLNEYFLASLDSNCVNVFSPSCVNYNYLSNYSSAFWTLTGSSDNTYQVYKIYVTPSASHANNSYDAKMVINISENTIVTGSGTEFAPYVVKYLED